MKNKTNKKSFKLKYSEFIVKNRILILIIAFVLLIPSFFGYMETRINYDILSYLPKVIETMKGQDIMVDDFGTGAFSLFMVEGMSDKDVSKLKSEIEDIDHVTKVIWYDSLADSTIPMEILPDDIYETFNSDDSTLMAIMFDETMSTDNTMAAISQIRELAGKQCFLSGMSAVILDTKNLSEQQTPIYVGIAVVCATVILMLTMDSYLIPFLFLLSIGMSIIYNLGSNIMFGEISFITQALTAVLQLGVTMDYFIFLWHSYEEQKHNYDDKNEAMTYAIASTIKSVFGSSITTVSGFVALCFMSFTLGLDLGLVMAKGVVLGVIACITILPALILVLDKPLEKTKHKSILPEFKKLPNFITKHYKIILIIFCIAWVPAIYGYVNTDVYYNLDETLPEDLESIVANAKLQDEFDMSSTHMLLLDSELPQTKVKEMSNKISDIDGVSAVLGIDSILPENIPEEMIPEDLLSEFKNGDYQYFLIMSEYKVASDEVNNQCNEIVNVVKTYDNSGMLIGEAPCTKDLIEITDSDFKTVSTVSIGIIFIIIAIIFTSIPLPIILVLVIEAAIYVNMGLSYYTGTVIPFISSIVIGTIQLGATVDYAILMTSRYQTERNNGNDKITSVRIASATSIKSIIVSALSFFAATFGVGLYSTIDMISSLCVLMARGAIISMITVIFVLPSMLMLFDKLIQKTYLKKPIKGGQNND